MSAANGAPKSLRACNLETFALRANALACADSAIAKPKRSERMRRYDFDFFDQAETCGIRVHDECADAAGPWLTSARKHDIKIRDTAVRNPCLLAAQHIGIVRLLRPRTQRGYIGTSFLFRKGKRRDRSAGGDFGQIPRLELLRAEQRDWTARQPLHREGEVGQTVMARERFTRQAQRAYV